MIISLESACMKKVDRSTSNLYTFCIPISTLLRRQNMEESISDLCCILKVYTYDNLSTEHSL